jgi:hypothetical protein
MANNRKFRFKLPLSPANIGICLVLTNLAYVTAKLASMHENGFDINEPARRSMQEKTIVPYEYNFDSARIFKTYSDDLNILWSNFHEWRAKSRQTAIDNFKNPTNTSKDKKNET